MLPITYHSDTSPTQCQPSPTQCQPSNVPVFKFLRFLPFLLHCNVFFHPLCYFSNHLKLHKYLSCPLVFPLYLFFFHCLSSQSAAEVQYELSISENNTAVSTTETLTRLKHVCLLANTSWPLADQPDGREVGEPQKGTTLLISNTVSIRNSLR